MKEGRPSQTALQVACWRALADIGLTSVKGFHDPTARHFLATPWSWLLAAAERGVRRGQPDRLRVLRHGADLLALRTMVIDQHVREALGEGTRQLVILGAGLDGRAYRLPALSQVRVFEVDHPATQAFKRSRAHELSTTAERLTFVSVDFERDSLDSALEASGHTKAEPTIWVWEGVVMYLTAAAIEETLRIISARSAPGSMLVVNYMTPSTRRGAIKLLLRLWGEPQVSEHTPAAMAAEIARAGLSVGEDTGIEDWAHRFEASIEDSAWTPGLRVVIARAGARH
jgi:methyltransferase (TIGR00027 family)